MADSEERQWDIIISPGDNLFKINIRELWDYRDLLYMLVARDMIAAYKQTILGPLWHFIQPLLTTVVFMVVFGGIARLPTDGMPPSIFYLSGILMWNYFVSCFEQTSDTFYQNAAIFGKVYFPRILMPVAKVIFGLFRFFIQSLLFIAVYLFLVFKGAELEPNISVLITPYLVLLMAGLGLGGGMIFSSITAKYRDLKFFITFGIQLLMFITPVIYPMSLIPENYRYLITWNPIAHLIEAFRYAYLGAGELSYYGILYATIFTILVLVFGMIFFNKTARDFMDTV